MSETYNKTDFLKNANVGTRVYNSETKKYYIKTKNGWQKDDRFFSSLGTRYSELAMKGSIQYDAHKDYYSNTIGKDGSFYLHKDVRGFTITDDHPLAEELRAAEQVRVTGRKQLAIKKQSDLYEKWNKVFTPLIDKKINEFNKLYPNNQLTREIVNEYYAATNKQEFVKNHPVLKHYSHVHLPYDQEGRYKWGLHNKNLFAEILHDLDKVERFNKEKTKLQKKYNIVPENNKDNKKGESFYDYHRNLTKFLEDNPSLSNSTKEVVKKGTEQLKLLQKEVNNNLSHEELLGIGGNN